MEPFPEDSAIIIPILFNQLGILSVIYLISQLQEIKCEFLLAGRLSIVNEFLKSNVAVETNQFISAVWVKMTFSVSANIGIVSNHRPAIVTAFDSH